MQLYRFVPAQPLALKPTENEGRSPASKISTAYQPKPRAKLDEQEHSLISDYHKPYLANAAAKQRIKKTTWKHHPVRDFPPFAAPSHQRRPKRHTPESVSVSSSRPPRIRDPTRILHADPLFTVPIRITLGKWTPSERSMNPQLESKRDIRIPPETCRHPPLQRPHGVPRANRRRDRPVTSVKKRDPQRPASRRRTSTILDESPLNTALATTVAARTVNTSREFHTPPWRI